MDDWWVTEKGNNPLRADRVTVAAVKRRLPVRKLLEHYDAELPDDASYWQSMRCPFHDDSRASASVNFKLNRFRCHGCDTGGDVIDIVVTEEGCENTKEALEWIRLNLL